MIQTATESFVDQGKPIKLWSQDEARFGRMNNPKKCWAPPHYRPVIRLQRVREYLYVFTANCPWTGETYSLIFPACNTNAMFLFLEGLSQEYGGYNNVRAYPKIK